MGGSFADMTITLQGTYIMATPKTPAFRIITDPSALTKHIKSIATRGKALDKDMHIAAVSALFHGFEHKSTAHAETLLASLPESARKKGLHVWLMDMGCFMVKEDGKTLGIDKNKQKEGFVKQADAIATPFFKYTQEAPVASPLIAMEEVQKLIKRLTKAKSEGKLDPDSSSVLDKLMTVAPSISEPALI